MNTFSMLFILFLMVNIFLGLIRVAKGPSTADRMIAGYLTGTIGAAIMLLLGEVTQNPALKDIALLFVLLGAMTLIAFVNRLWTDKESTR